MSAELDEAAPVREALVIAVTEYRDPKLPGLWSAGTDGYALSQVLGDPAIGDFKVDFALNETSNQLSRRLARFFADRKPDDLLLLYFGGHGVRDKRGELHLVATDTETDLLSPTAISANWLSEQLDDCAAGAIVLLLDCSYSGAFPFNATGFGTRVLVAASGAREMAFERTDSSGETHSVFTATLVEGLTTGAADSDRDGLISVDDLYDYVDQHMKMAGVGQTPWKVASGSGLLRIARAKSGFSSGRKYRVFIAYRRADTTAGYAALLSDSLESRGFDVTLDIGPLQLGADWRATLGQEIARADVTLVLIGRLWMSVTDEAGRRRLDDPSDFVRFEIAAALRSDSTTVIPVLFGDTQMPHRDELPADIRELVSRQAWRWHVDKSSTSQLEDLVDVLRKMELHDSERERATSSEKPDFTFNQLTTSSTNAVRRAEYLRQKVGAPQLYTEHLVWGLGQKQSGSVRELLGIVMEPGRVSEALDRLVGLSGSAAPDGPPVELSALPFSPNCRASIAAAAALAGDAVRIRERQLLAGILSVPVSRGARWLESELALPIAQLRELVAIEDSEPDGPPIADGAIAAYRGVLKVRGFQHAAKAADHLGDLLVRSDQTEDAVDAYRHSLGIKGNVFDLRAEVHIRDKLGACYRYLKRSEDALATYESIVKRCAGATDPALRMNAVRALTEKSSLLIELERHSDAAAALEQSLVLSRELDDREGEARAMANLGSIQERLLDLDPARANYGQAVAIFHELGAARDEAQTLQSLGILLSRQADFVSAELAFTQSLELARQRNDHDLEASGLLNLAWCLSHLGQHRHAVDSAEAALSVAHKIGNERIERAAVEALSELTRARTDVTRYELSLDARRTEVAVGEVLVAEMLLTPVLDAKVPDDRYLVEAGVDELTILLDAPGFRVEDDDVAVLTLDPRAGDGNTVPSQSAIFTLTALQPGPATVSASVFRGSNLETTLSSKVSVAVPAVAVKTAPTGRPRARAVPPPDLELRVRTRWEPDLSSCVFEYELTSVRSDFGDGEPVEYHSQTLPAGWLDRARGMLATALSDTIGAAGLDTSRRFASVGQQLWRQLVPSELQRDLALLGSSRTLQLVADGDAWAPWELLHDGHAFLGERFVIGRWPLGLDEFRPTELPVGSVTVAYYEGVDTPARWMPLLQPQGAPDPILLPRGILAGETPLQGLHLVRQTSPHDDARRDAPVTAIVGGGGGGDDFSMTKLSMRRQRPIVTIGFLRGSQPAVASIEQTWARGFLQARCSALVGPLWAVGEDVEAAFLSQFYERIWAGASLGEAITAARRLARAVNPASIDWLAYALFGDPMGRPYRPISGPGYAVVERVGGNLETPVAPGESARFRASLRRSPPAWHEERVLEVAQELEYDDLNLHVLTFGLQINPDPPIKLARTPDGDHLGWFTLVVPSDSEPGDGLIQLHFTNGEEVVHSLTFVQTIDYPRA